jgi:hypothetical protein
MSSDDIPKDITELAEKIEKIEKIPPRVPGDPDIRIIYIAGKKLMLKSSELINRKKFQQRFLEAFDVLPTPKLAKFWAEFVSLWPQPEITTDPEEDDDQIASKKFLVKIMELPRTTNREMLLREHNFIYQNDEKGALEYPSTNIPDLLVQLGIKTRINRLIPLLGNAKVPGHHTLRINSNVVIGVWRFLPGAFSDETESGDKDE